VQIISDIRRIPGQLREWGVERVLVVTGPSRRFLDRLDLEGFDVHVFDRAKKHVPGEIVAAAKDALGDAQAVVTLGGGAATGVGKMLRLEREPLRFVAIPTTYSGSEVTRIWGTTDDGEKRTGRDDRVRPDLVVHDESLLETMPRQLAVESLLNALAHPISALSTDALDDSQQERALRAVTQLAWALDQVAGNAHGAADKALEGTALAARVLDEVSLGAHHRAAHALGGAFDLPHAQLHAMLLPAFLRWLPDELRQSIGDASGHADFPAALFDLRRRVGAPRGLIDLGVDASALEHEALSQRFVRDAYLGRCPSVHVRRWDTGESVRGPALADAWRVVIALHGRGSTADAMLREALDLVRHDPRITLVAPQAPERAWYPGSYRASLEEHGADLERSLAQVEATLAHVLEYVPPERVFLAGFSQGACLAAEVFARTEVRLGGLVAIAGARVGPIPEQPAITRDLGGSSALLAVAARDRWVDVEDVEHTAELFGNAGADVDLRVLPGDAHEIPAQLRSRARELLRDERERIGLRGAGGHESEALAGALPRRQNTPRRVRHGLHAELVSGTGFLAPRAHNRRVWLYRIRPSAQHTPFAPLAHPRLRADWDAVDPNLAGWRPLPIPEEPTDFVDGLATFGGAGSPQLRRGYAIHLYAANRSMEHRAFHDADGDLLIVPQLGGLGLQTELGWLDVRPGEVAVVPQGMKVSVHLLDGEARGYVGETYGRHFELPERGPSGSNGLVDARHLRAPSATFEDRLDPGYRITAKLGNALYEATQDHAPYDVVAWHGEYTPWVYDLADFSPIGNTRFDHPDPSIHVVLSAPLDETGSNTLDFVFFPPRWDPTENTLRPPFFHRNVTTEFNGILSDPGLREPFHEGGYFLTPALTPHGVMARAIERARDDDDSPVRIPDQSRWFQFEAALPLALTRWARSSENRIEEWPHVWGEYRPHFEV